MKLGPDMLAKMRDASTLLQSSGPMAATAAIQRALQGLSIPGMEMPAPGWSAPGSGQPGVMRDINPAAAVEAAALLGSPDFLARLRQAPGSNWAETLADAMADTMAENRSGNWTDVLANNFQKAPAVTVDLAGKGKYLAGSCTNHAGTRAYKLYVPSAYDGQALPLIVMLHGCKQNPDDFAAGTQMNAIAEENDCFVVYPGQAQGANGSNCWNWFNSGDQQRDQGEPSIIASITREIISAYHIDARRVYVAGLSAGGAMAAVMAQTYPELYAAVGIHSGLAHGAAHDMMSAFTAMKNGKAAAALHAGAGAAAGGQAVAAIVFHGDRDQTVAPCNGEQALAQCLPSAADKVEAERRTSNAKVHRAAVPNGRSYTQTIHYDDNGKAIAEQWLVHGAGHAWSGGSSQGSYTDPKGPDAAQEMVRFFSAQAQAA